jgi:hypothetical protein
MGSNVGWICDSYKILIDIRSTLHQARSPQQPCQTTLSVLLRRSNIALLPRHLGDDIGYCALREGPCSGGIDDS